MNGKAQGRVAPSDGGTRRGRGQLEAEVLDALWSADRALSCAEVRDGVGTVLAYTTVLTILTRLHDKGVLERTRSGRSHVYRPVADPAGLVARRMHAVLDTERDHDSVLAQFVSTLDVHDEQVLRSLLARRRRTSRS